MSEQRPTTVRVVIRPLARQDIGEILGFTERRWGKGQREAYRAMLLAGINGLASNPERGRSRDDVFPGCRSVLIGTHHVFHRMSGNRVLVLRVLHTSQNVTDETEF